MTGIDRYYHVLGLQPGASAQEIKQAYRDMAKVWHPDRFLDDPRLQARAQEHFKEIHQAYHVLQTQQARPTDFDYFHQRPRRGPATAGDRQTPRQSQQRSNRTRSMSHADLAYQRFIRVAKVIALVLTVILVRNLLTLLVGE